MPQGKWTNIKNKWKFFKDEKNLYIEINEKRQEKTEKRMECLAKILKSKINFRYKEE